MRANLNKSRAESSCRLESAQIEHAHPPVTWPWQSSTLRHSVAAADLLFLHNARKPHANRRQHAGVLVHEDGLHAKAPRNRARVLSAGAAKARQHVLAYVQPSRLRERADGAAHCLVGDVYEAQRHIVRRLAGAVCSRRVNLGREVVQRFARTCNKSTR